MAIQARGDEEQGMAERARFEDGWWQSADGLRLHYRHYPGGADGRPPILCLPGLTRNARDFELLAERLSPEWRVICAELRGRGESAHAPDPASYQPPVYLNDIEALIAGLGLDQLVLFGTSLGGLLAALLTAARPERVAGVLLNDIGPAIEPGGLARIRGYVGKGASWPTWLHAARGLAEAQGGAFPDYDIEDWLGMAKRLCRLTPNGRIVFDYDLRIAEPMRAPEVVAPPDLWPAFEALAGRPLLLVRGALSDILSEATAHRMVARIPGLVHATVPRVGHAPTLNEPEAARAIDRLLARVAGGRTTV
ncbi:alpha/beta fold hydrolase [Sphingomonas morindae]|uniref:Alpha/beta hydrolase n=1 Tax=Sphingomonas morindae TaxID=1541170 RepID=A0ABY4X848_9SPHN|nr:alpha/beta hydrolase [Sphingomonas morindae]USI73118.1 alpha/beta hydrolase [Sphingomonas morindae]